MMEIKKSVRFRLMPRKVTDKASGKKVFKKKDLLIVMTVTYCGNRIGLSTNGQPCHEDVRGTDQLHP